MVFINRINYYELFKAMQCVLKAVFNDLYDNSVTISLFQSEEIEKIIVIT